MSNLENENFYWRLDEDPTEWFAEEVPSLLLYMTDKHAISNEIFNYLRPKKPWTSRFYILSKIHKDDIPGRPIVSSCRAPTENLSRFSIQHAVMVDLEGCLTPTCETDRYSAVYSCHPSHCKWGIPYSRVLKIGKICSKKRTIYGEP